MESESYRGYNVWGHAILQQEASSSRSVMREAGPLLRAVS
jgi:hypothetical protein